MLDTGGDVRDGLPDAADEEPGERVLLTVAVRDYDDEDNAEEFAEGIDRQLDAVRTWWGTPGPLPPFRQVLPPGLRHRDDVEDFLRRENVRELRGLALTLFITGHGIAASADTHFLRLPATEERRPLATAVRTADIIAAALDSHVENVLVIVNTCFAGNLQSDLAAVHKEIRASRLASARIDVLGTCGIKTKIEVLRFPTLLQDALRYLRRTAGITTPHLSVPEFMHEYARHLPPADSKKFKLQHLIQAGDHEPSPCLPNPGYVHVPGQSAAVEQGALSAEYWLDRATGRPQEHDSNWYFRGREELNRKVAAFLRSPRGVLLISGCAGSGKSAVLARAVTLSNPAFRRTPLFTTAAGLSPEDTVPPEGAVTAAVPARNLNAARVAGDLLVALGVTRKEVEATDDPVAVWSQQLQDHVRTCGRPVTIVLDGLDEAHEQARIIGDVLAPLAPYCGTLVPGTRRPSEPGLPAVRLLVGVRASRTVDDAPHLPRDDGPGLLQALRHAFPAARVEHTDGAGSRTDMALYLEALIGDALDHDAVDEVVSRVVDVVWPSFIDARLAGDQLRRADDPLALARSEDWYKRTLTSGIRGLLQRDLRMAEADGLPPQYALALLKAAAFAKGQGVPRGEVWPAIAGVFLSPRTLDAGQWDRMIEKLLGSRLNGYLAQAVEDDRRVYRPAHEELADVLLDPDTDLLAEEGPDA
ncbi:ATP-binding protein [Streptomyces sp. SID9913]|uniref:ATP-binding protein n=1 Tax=Streptomyces sp. SID9913 TaxID=2706117 RepID=UPI0013DAA331|nr:ATP-binding protein [Streptomyces sp. SID9913]MBM7089168.1 ATP-binding protein [Streptomyces sp. S12]NED19706.1 ATP-binding protein [Streptomyces sp. SID9913]